MDGARRANSILALPLIGAVRLYQVLLSPLMGGRCRFTPSCSNYALEALRAHGPAKGAYLAGRRVLRCHPFGGSGYDPVPPSTDREDGAKHLPGPPAR